MKLNFFSNRFIVSVSILADVFLESGRIDIEALGSGLYISKYRTEMESRELSPVEPWAWAAFLEHSPHKMSSILGSCSVNFTLFEGRTNYD